MSGSARKAFDLLSIVVTSERPMGVMELSVETGYDKSTTSRLLGMLEKLAFVSRDDIFRTYSVGPAFISLAVSAIGRTDTRQELRLSLADLRDLTGETVTLHIRAGDQRVCIDGVESAMIVRRVVRIGEARPLISGVSGRMILASMPESEAKAILVQGGLRKELSRLMSELDSIRHNGYLVDMSQRTTNLVVASAPCRLVSGELAAIAIAGPADRWTMSKASQFIPDLLTACRKIESLQGMASQA